MGINQLVGTPWHIERVHREENDNRRHKSNCKYYTNDKCLKLGFRCFGSAHCDDYKEKIKQNKPMPIPGKYTLVQRKPYGTFSVMFLDDNEELSFEIGININPETELVKQVIENEINEVITVNSLKARIIKKNIYFK